LKSVLIYVQHLLGIGHLKRVELIAAALVKNNLSVTIISGGIGGLTLPLEKIKVVQLPGIKSDSGFSNLYDVEGNPVSEEMKEDRIKILLSTLRKAKPDFLLIETYPFGRRQMRFEIMPLIECAINTLPHKPILASSIRDIIQPKSPGKKTEEIVSTIDKYFDWVFVHGEEGIVNFEETFPQCTQFSNKLIYTGYVAQDLKSKPPSDIREKRIIVSAGGGAVGEDLYHHTLEAAKTNLGSTYQWHFLIGYNIPEQQFQRLLSSQNSNIRIDRNRPDFTDLLSQSKISLSQAGYNTVMDIVQSGAHGIVIPFEGIGEKEQLLRSQAFSNLGLLHVLRENELCVDSIIAAIENIEKSADETQYHSKQLSLNGASRTAQLIKKFIINK
jgi:predicted glycosyltransferase